MWQSRGWHNWLLQSRGVRELPPPWGADTLPALAQRCPRHGRRPSRAQTAAPPGLRCRNLAALPAPAPQRVGGGLGLPLLQKAGGPPAPPAPACHPRTTGPSWGAGTVTLVQGDLQDLPVGAAKPGSE